MTIDDYNAFCGALTHTTHVVQWGGAHVWKVGGKVFAIGAGEGRGLSVSFKCTPMTFEIFKDARGVRPAPYLASRGMTWLQRTGPETLKDSDLKDCLRDSYRLVAAGLPKRVQVELGLAPVPGAAPARARAKTKAAHPRAREAT